MAPGAGRIRRRRPGRRGGGKRCADRRERTAPRPARSLRGARRVPRRHTRSAGGGRPSAPRPGARLAGGGRSHRSVACGGRRAMRLSVLIPVYDRRAQLAQCLEALARQTLPREEFEVIVCDDGSDDQPETLAADFASALDLKFVRRPHANRAAALNGGFEAARGDVIVFTDSDMVPTPSLLEKHRDFHRRDPRPQAAMLGYMDWYPGLTVTRFMRHIVSDSAWQFGYTTLTDGGVVTWGYFYGGNTSVKREFLAAHGVHDESFARAEDVELGYRLSQAGMELVYDASAVNYHNHFVTVRDFACRNQNVGRAPGSWRSSASATSSSSSARREATASRSTPRRPSVPRCCTRARRPRSAPRGSTSASSIVPTWTTAGSPRSRRRSRASRRRGSSSIVSSPGVTRSSSHGRAASSAAAAERPAATAPSAGGCSSSSA